MDGQMSLFDLDTWSGKMSQEPSVATKERTSASSLKKQRGSKSRMPLFLDLRKNRSGVHQEPSWVTGGAWLGAFTTHSFGESPKEENASLLSQILEDTPHPKYSLSAKACLGILNRAERRGKKLPEELETALRAQSAFRNEPESQGGVAIVQAIDVYNQSIDGDIAATVTGACGGSNTSGPKVMAVDFRKYAEDKISRCEYSERQDKNQERVEELEDDIKELDNTYSYNQQKLNSLIKWCKAFLEGKKRKKVKLDEELLRILVKEVRVYPGHIIELDIPVRRVGDDI